MQPNIIVLNTICIILNYSEIETYSSIKVIGMLITLPLNYNKIAQNKW